MRKFLPALLLALILLPATSVSAQSGEPEANYFRARVTAIEHVETDASMGLTREVQTVRLRLESGPEEGTETRLENGIVNDREDMRLHEGDRVVLEQLEKSDGTVRYLVREQYRLPALVMLVAGFCVLAVLLGGLMGLTSLLGLGVSIGVLVIYVVPAIGGGQNPLAVSLIGSFIIACTSLYLAHGFHKRTTVALLSTLLTLGISVLLAMLFVRVAKLFGTGTEEAMFLQLGPLEQVNLRGLLLGGMVIGCLGVLDDITTAQTAAVDEIRKANPSLTASELWRAGMSVGREHIAALINTLALAYAGASLPLLLLFRTQGDLPLWLTLNSEFLAEEIIRTLVGSTTLLFAVPLSTWLAVTVLPKLKGGGGHTHFHAHP